jgi:hypothetical protein
MDNRQRYDDHNRGDREPREGDQIAERLQGRHIAHQLPPDQRRQHDQKGKSQQGDGADQHIDNRLKPQHPP